MFPFVSLSRKPSGIFSQIALAGLLLGLAGCGLSKAESDNAQARGQQAQAEQPAAVNVAIARTGNVEAALDYTGTTQPVREVSLRSQVEAQLLELTVDVGDRVTEGQTLAQLDSNVQVATVAEARAEVAARQAEVADAQVQVTDAQTQVNRARSELQQAQSDLNRLEFLARQGAIAEQEAEQARTAVDTAEQTLRSAEEQVRSRQQRVVAAQERVEAQRAVVAQEQQQQSFTELTSPVTGSVLERISEPGNLVRPGDAVLRLGDFSQIKVVVQVSELELRNIQPGQTVQVRLDAFPNQEFSGRVSRVSPAADPVARLVPIEVTLPNPDGRIGSGLLARATFRQSGNQARVVVPETALQANQERRSGQQSGGQPQGGANQPRSGGDQQSQSSGSDRAPSSNGQSANPSTRRSNLPRDVGTVFVVEETGSETKVSARPVTLGRRGEGQVEIISGLQAGDRYVTRSSKALKTGDTVRLSVLSEQNNSQSNATR